MSSYSLYRKYWIYQRPRGKSQKQNHCSAWNAKHRFSIEFKRKKRYFCTNAAVLRISRAAMILFCFLIILFCVLSFIASQFWNLFALTHSFVLLYSSRNVEWSFLQVSLRLKLIWCNFNIDLILSLEICFHHMTNDSWDYMM